MNNGDGKRWNGGGEEDEDDDEESGGPDGWQITYADERSWESLQEDESGLLRPIDNKILYHAQYRRRIRSLSSQATTARIQKGLIRYLFVIIDFSRVLNSYHSTALLFYVIPFQLCNCDRQYDLRERMYWFQFHTLRNEVSGVGNKVHFCSKYSLLNCKSCFIVFLGLPFMFA